MQNLKVQIRLYPIIPWYNTLILAILLILCLPESSYAQTQNIQFEPISIDQGLSQSSIHCILQDRKGFIWFGTQDGLNRYDGYRFTVYKHTLQDSTALSDNYVRCLYEDRTGRLWIGTDGGGLNRFDRERETFTHYRHDPEDPQSLSHDRIWCIYEDHQGLLWIGTYGGGLARFNPEKEAFTPYRHDPEVPHSLSDDRITSIYEDHQGTLWIGTEEGGLDRFNRSEGTFKHYRHDPNNPRNLSHDRVRSIYEDHQGTLWIGTWNGLNKFDRASETFTRYALAIDWESTEVTSIYEDQNRILWLGTLGHGICLFDPATETSSFFQHDPSNPYSLRVNDINTLYQDRSGLLWIGTWGGGISRFDPNVNFRHYTHIPGDPYSLSNRSVRAIYEDRDSVLWVGSYGGLDRFDRKRGVARHYRPDPRNPYSLSNINVYAIHEDREGTLWIGTEGGGLYRFDRKTEQFTPYRYDTNNPSDVRNDFIFVIYEDREGTLWVGSFGGLAKFDRKTGQFSHYSNDPHNPESLSGNTVRAILEDRNGVFWVGTDGGGLNRFDRERETFTHYRHDDRDSTSLSSDRIKCIYEDQAGTLWIGTDGGGLNRLNRAEGTFKPYMEKEGLPNNVVYGILEDDRGNLWLSTNKGLSRFNPGRETFRNYDVRDGLQSNEFNTAAYYKSRSGEMFFGGINGLTAFYPGQIRDNLHIPPVVLTAFQKFDQETKLSKSITETERIDLTYKEYIFSFEFAALDYRSPLKNQYAYMMEGLDKDWVASGTRRFVTYTHLNPGEYVFRVKGSNNDGVWNEEGTAVQITITPPPWKTWWAYSLYGLVLIAVVTGYVRLQSQKLERERQVTEQLSQMTASLKQEITDRKEAEDALLHSYEQLRNLSSHLQSVREEERKRIAREIHDELGQTLTALQMDLYNLEDLFPEAQADLFTKTGSMKKLIDRSIETVQRLCAALRPGLLDDLGLIAAIEWQAGEFQERTGIPCDLTVEFEEMSMDQERSTAVFRIFQELLTNVVRHAQASCVQVRVQVDDDTLTLTVCDNGKGITEEQITAPNSFGLIGIRERLYLWGGKINIVGRAGEGTTVTVTIPLGAGESDHDKNIACR